VQTGLSALLVKLLNIDALLELESH